LVSPEASMALMKRIPWGTICKKLMMGLDDESFHPSPPARYQWTSELSYTVRTILESSVNLHAIEPCLMGQRRNDGLASPSHRANAVVGL